MGKLHCMASFHFDWILFDLFACSKATESSPVKQETSCTVILPPRVSVLWSIAVLPEQVSRLKMEQTFLIRNNQCPQLKRAAGNLIM